MLNSMLKIFVGPVMGGGLNPHQPPVNTPLAEARCLNCRCMHSAAGSRHSIVYMRVGG
jgi:hypothetical protein